MKKAILFLAGLAVFVSALGAAEPQVLGKWSGSGMKQTESFAPSKRECQIAWTAKATTSVPGILQIYVHDENDRLIDLAANTMEDGADSSIIRFDPAKKYYLKIVAANTRWTVTVRSK